MSTTTIIQNETFNNLLAELQLEDYQPSANAQALINAEARYIKDLKINTGNVLNYNSSKPYRFQYSCFACTMI